MQRFVTGKGSDGRAAIVIEGAVGPLAGMPGSQNETRLVWATREPVKVSGDVVDPVAGAVMSLPGPGESRFVFVTFAPRSRTPMHATPTIDHVAVVAGELWLIMEDGSERRLVSGDAVIQNGTVHAWANRSAEPCTIAVTMIGASAVSTSVD